MIIYKLIYLKFVSENNSVSISDIESTNKAAVIWKNKEDYFKEVIRFSDNNKKNQTLITIINK